MIVQHHLSHPIWQKKTPVDSDNILRHCKPGAFRAIILLKRLCQRHIAQILMVMELQFLVHGNDFVYIDVSKTDFRPLVRVLLKYMQDTRLFLSCRYRIIIPCKRNGVSCPADQIHLRDLIGCTIMHIYSTRMDLMVCLGFVHLRDLMSVLLREQLEPGLVHITQAVIPCRKCRSRPGKSSGKAFYFSGA